MGGSLNHAPIHTPDTAAAAAAVTQLPFNFAHQHGAAQYGSLHAVSSLPMSAMIHWQHIMCNVDGAVPSFRAIELAVDDVSLLRLLPPFGVDLTDCCVDRSDFRSSNVIRVGSHSTTGRLHHSIRKRHNQSDRIERSDSITLTIHLLCNCDDSCGGDE